MRQISAADLQPDWTVLQPLDGCRERAIALNKPVCVAGDRARVNLTLRDGTVSRAHAIFVSDEHGVYLRDLASLNHVFINEEPVRESSLQLGDVLKIGPYAFRCEGGASAKPEAAHQSSRTPAGELRTPDSEIHVPLNTRLTTLLGNRDDCDVKMAGSKVSPAHAIIFEMHGRRYIRDLRSMSGTFVNDKKVGQCELHPDDEILIGDSKLVYASAPSHDPDGTLAGILAEDATAELEKQPTVDEDLAFAPTSDEPIPIASVPSSEEIATPSDDVDVIPLMDDSAELKSMAREFAEDRNSETKPAKAPEPLDSKADDSAIIPLLDESEFAPGLSPEPTINGAIPAADDLAIPLADESNGSAVARDVAFTKPSRAKKRDAGEPKTGKRKQGGKSSDSRMPGREASTR